MWPKSFFALGVDSQLTITLLSRPSMTFAEWQTDRHGTTREGETMNTELLIELILVLVRILAAGQFG